ncbi:MAG: FAD-dependent hydroxylase [Cyanobacteria bacterium]|nr:FAD-dependent hydroxylase [Cyanobacteriota bacterium]MDA0867570.1 FAD-dependent hydroxylase [Cyanobacteriota bacterium]
MTLLQTRPNAQSDRNSPVRHYNLVIVGGGIVGLTLASALRRSGLTIAIVETQTPAQAASRPRAYAFSPVSRNIFEQLGLWDQVGPQVTHFQRVRLTDGDWSVGIDFRPQDLGDEPVYYAAEHAVLMAALQGSVQGAHNLDYLAPAQVQQVRYGETVVECDLEQAGRTWTCTTDLLVAADGGRSPLRQQAEISTLGWQYWQSCITTVVAPEHPHQNTAYEKFWPSGPFAILPLPNGHCQIVWTAPNAEAQALMALPRTEFVQALQRRYGDQMGRLKMLKEPLLFPVRLMQSRQYVKPRLALIGDAAHSCHPVGGQGLNMGIRDAAALAEVLIKAHQQGEDLGHLPVLQRYQRWRRWENNVVLSMTDVLNRCFSNYWLPLVGVRRLGIFVLQRVRPFRWLALQLMTGRFGHRPTLD